MGLYKFQVQAAGPDHYEIRRLAKDSGQVLDVWVVTTAELAQLKTILEGWNP